MRLIELEDFAHTLRLVAIHDQPPASQINVIAEHRCAFINRIVAQLLEKLLMEFGVVPFAAPRPPQTFSLEQ